MADKTIISGKGSIYDLLKEAGLDRFNPDFPCGGKKTCGKCRVRITGGARFVSPPDETEKKFISEKDLAENIRYACMCMVSGEVEIEPAPGAAVEKMEIQAEGLQSKNITPDKFKRFAGGAAGVYGAAVDIGTTTVAVYLHDMATGECLGTATEENPQRAYGADVITRINHTIENENGLDDLKSLVLSLVLRLITELCEKNDISKDGVYSVVLTGNTVMQHIAMGFPPKTIATAPFTPVSLFGFEIMAAEIGLTGLNQNALVYFPPAFASYVGGDIATGIIASDTDLCGKLRLFLDIGTNGEIGLGGKDSLIFCATAMGPAFEGAHIKFGMAGVKGAINKIYLGENNRVIYETIGGAEPKGICGSGIIDAVALMIDLEAIDETGRLEEDFYITPDIYITQQDVREILLAKAAVCAGIITLLHHTGKSIADIDELILAGGFGAHINKKSACKIGLIPQELEDKIITAGNTAGTGAAAVLLDSSAEGRINRAAEKAKYIELSGDPFFRDEYIEQMMF